MGEERRAGGAEGHLDRGASARGAPGGGAVVKIGYVAPRVEEDGGVVTVALGKGRRIPIGGGHGGEGEEGFGTGWKESRETVADRKSVV